MPNRARLFAVTGAAGDRTFTSHVSALTRSKAMADAWRSASDAWDISFRDFLKIARVRAADTPPPDAYAYVRLTYGVDVAVGERVSVRGERAGEVVYPGGSTTAHVHVLFDGMEFAMPVHPSDIIQEIARHG